MKLVFILILLMSMLIFVPPLFSDGQIFNQNFILETEINVNNIHFDKLKGKHILKTIETGKHFANVFYTIFFLLMAFIGIAIPFLFHKLQKPLKWVSTLIGAWYFSGFVAETFNFTLPDIVLCNSVDSILYTRFSLLFIFSMSFIIMNELWTKQQKN